MSGIVARLRSKSGSLPVVLSSALLGAALGVWQPRFAANLSIVGSVYVGLLGMVVMPFMVSAVIYSLSRLMNSGDSSEVLGRVVKLLLAAMVAGALFAVLAFSVAGPGRNLPPETLMSMGEIVGEDLNGRIEMPLLQPLADIAKRDYTELALSVVPANIFRALANGDMLKVLVFSLIFGVVVGRLPAQYSDPLNAGLRGIYEACLKLTRWLNSLLPVVLFAMVAQQVATSGIAPLQAMAPFLVTLAVVELTVIGLSVALVRWTSGASWAQVGQAMRAPLVMAMATRSSAGCMPLIVDSLSDRLGFKRASVELTVPLGVSLMPIANAMFFTGATAFIAQLYGRELAVLDWAIVVTTSIMLAMAAAGLSTLATLSMTGIVCSLVGLPFQALMVLFIAIDPLCDMLGTTTKVAAIHAFSALGCRKAGGTGAARQRARDEAARSSTTPASAGSNASSANTRP